MRIFYLAVIGILAVSINGRVDVDDGYWGEWSNCTIEGAYQECGGGITRRMKMCYDLPDEDFMCGRVAANCNMMDCDNPFKNTDFDNCTESCGGGLRSRNGTYDNGTDTSQTINCHTQRCPDNLVACNGTDLVILVDSSKSISSWNWPEIKQFLVDLTIALKLDMSKNRIALITFSTHVKNIFHLNDNYTEQDYVKMIWETDYLAGVTATAEGLMEMKKEFDNYADPARPHIGLVISDGAANILMDLTIPSANEIKADGTYVIGIGVGEYNVEEMTQIVSSPSNFSLFQAGEISTLSKVVDQIVKKLCNATELRPCSPCEYTDCEAEGCNVIGLLKGTSKCFEIDFDTGEIVNEKVVTCRKMYCYKTCPTTTVTPEDTTPEDTEASTTTKKPDHTKPDCFRCDFTKGQIWRPDYLNCHLYYVCEPTTEQGVYRYYNMTCGQQYWNQEILACDDHKTGSCEVGDVVTVAPFTVDYTCPLSVYGDDDTRFWTFGDESSVQTCPRGLFFNPMSGFCVCVTRLGVTVPTDGCESELVLDIPYDDHYDDVTCHKAKAIQYGVGVELVDDADRGTVACFNGSSHFEVPFMRNWFAENEVEQFTVEMYVKTSAAQGPEFAGILNNADCKVDSTFEFSGENTGIFAEGTTDGSGTQRSSTVAVPADVWVHFLMTYDGSNFKLYVDSLLVYTMPAYGMMTNNHVPLIIGNRCNEHYFVGCLDDIKVWNKVVDIDIQMYYTTEQ